MNYKEIMSGYDNLHGMSAFNAYVKKHGGWITFLNNIENHSFNNGQLAMLKKLSPVLFGCILVIAKLSHDKYKLQEKEATESKKIILQALENEKEPE